MVCKTRKLVMHDLPPGLSFSPTITGHFRHECKPSLCKVRCVKNSFAYKRHDVQKIDFTCICN